MLASSHHSSLIEGLGEKVTLCKCDVAKEVCAYSLGKLFLSPFGFYSSFVHLFLFSLSLCTGSFAILVRWEVLSLGLCFTLAECC